ncbi:MAG: hypothetical protein QF619_03690, partial [Candidatus Binatia bacterium]|nr:hypothetical protein [Candidatus Binatia bacterium]
RRLSGLFYNLFFLIRVWEKYSELPSDVREPLAYVIVSLMDWRQIGFLSLPLLALLIIIILQLAVLPYLLPAHIYSFLFHRFG